jgi:hypothetical protein
MTNASTPEQAHSPRTQAAVREIGASGLAAIGAAVVGVAVWLVAVLFGICADVIGVVFHRPEDYPYSDAWVVCSAALGAAAAGAVLWAARPGRGSEQDGARRSG